MIGILPFLGSFTSGPAGETVEPEVMAELYDISEAFAADHSGIKLLPHERRQLARIKLMAKRDRRSAMATLRLWARRAREARKTIRVRAA